MTRSATRSLPEKDKGVLAGARHLVIVESPTKARAIERALNGFTQLLARAATGELEDRGADAPSNPLIEDWASTLTILAAHEGVAPETLVEQIQALPSRYRVIPTYGHFRSLFAHTPRDNRPARELPDWRLPQFRRGWSEEDVEDYRAFYREFLQSHPTRSGDSPDKPETNPKRYLAVDVASGYRPIWQVTNPSVGRRLVEAAAEMSETAYPGEPHERPQAGIVYLATDPDREGELIAWHVRGVLEDWAEEAGVNLAYRRMRYQSVTFGELSRSLLGFEDGRYPGIESANRTDPGLVTAAAVREVLDRLIGYPLTQAIKTVGFQPVYSNGNPRTLSAGRVQVAALDLLLNDEEEALQQLPRIHRVISATVNGVEFAGRTTGELPADVVQRLHREPAQVAEHNQVQETKAPPPFLTLADYQQTMLARASTGPSKALAQAQALFQHGATTYPRTDTRRVSAAGRRELEALGEAAGLELTDQVRSYGSNAASQEAHEALRPKVEENEQSLGALFASYLREGAVSWPRFVSSRSRRKWDPGELKAWEVIARRSLAPLMPDAVIDREELVLEHPALVTTDGEQVMLRAIREQPVVEGYLQVWPRKEDFATRPLPDLGPQEPVRLLNVELEYEIEEPRRANPQYLIRELDELGIGRPSSTAGLIDKLERRGYVKRRRGPRSGGMSRFGAFIASWLRNCMGSTVDLCTTTRMERSLDALANMEPEPEQLREEAARILNEFYRGVADDEPIESSRQFIDRLRIFRHVGRELQQNASPGFLDPEAIPRRLVGFEGVEPADPELSRQLPGGWVPHGSIWMRALPGELVAIWRAPDLDPAWQVRLFWLYEDDEGHPMTMMLGASASQRRSAMRQLEQMLQTASLLRNEVPSRTLSFPAAWQLAFAVDQYRTGGWLDWDSTFPTLRRYPGPMGVEEVIENLAP